MWEQCLLQLSYLFDHFHHMVRNAQQSVGSNNWSPRSVVFIRISAQPRISAHLE